MALGIVPSSADQLSIDGLPTNDSVNIGLQELTITSAKKRLNWATSPLADGAALIGDEDHYDNAEMVGKLRIYQQGSMDETFDILSGLTAKFQEARKVRGGLPATWQPANSARTMNIYILEAEWDDFPVGRDTGWMSGSPNPTFHLYLRPFGLGVETLVPVGLNDPFVTNSIANGQWRFDTGVGEVTAGLGAMTITTAAGTKRLYRASTFTDQTITIRLKLGTTKTGTIGVVKRKDGTDRLVCQFDPTAGTIAIRNSAGALATSTPTFATATGTFYWLQVTVSGDDVSGAIYDDSANPLTNSAAVPLALINYTLTGGDATNFGSGKRGNPGVTIAPSDTSWQVADFFVTDAPDIENSDPIFGFEVSNVGGDVPAEGRMIITDKSSQTRSHVEWGLEQRNYNPATAPPYLIDSDALVTSGFAGNPNSTALVGRFDPNASEPSTIYAGNISSSIPLTICSTGVQFHVGTFKVKARVIGTTDMMLRLAWQVGDGSFRRNNYCDPILGVNWEEIDLGTIIIPEAGIGTQYWQGRIEAFGVEGGLFVDYIELIPLERYGIARAPLQPIQPTTYSVLDHFNQGSSALEGTGLTVGPGTWDIPGATNDFTVDYVNAHRVKRVAVGDDAGGGPPSLDHGRLAIAGSFTAAGIQVRADVGTVGGAGTFVDLNDQLRMGIVLRWTNASNFVMAVRQLHSDALTGIGGGQFYHSTRLRVIKVLAGASTVLGNFDEHAPPTTIRTIVCSIDAAGVWQATSFPAGKKQPARPQLSGQDGQLASGTLASGNVGLYDCYLKTPTPVLTRTYDNFVAFAPTPDAVIWSGQTLEIRSDRTERQAASGGTNYGRPPMYRGSRMYIPPTGTQGNPARIAVKARRTDVDEGLPDNPVTDTINVALFATPRFLVVPH